MQKSEPAVSNSNPAKQEASATPVVAQHKVQNSEPAVPKSKPAKQEASTTPVVAQRKVDYATDLFNLLSMDDSKENDSKTSADEKSWASFQCNFLNNIIKALFLLWYLSFSCFTFHS